MWEMYLNNVFIKKSPNLKDLITFANKTTESYGRKRTDLVNEIIIKGMAKNLCLDLEYKIKKIEKF